MNSNSYSDADEQCDRKRNVRKLAEGVRTHFSQVEKNYWKSDHIQEEMVDELRINIGDGEEDDESEGSE